MLDYMDYVVKAFEAQTGWSSDNSYENITATSRSLLQFAIPQSVRLQTSNKSTSHSFNTLELTRGKRINGSLTYLYTDVEGLGKVLRSSKSIALQNATETYTNVQPSFSHYMPLDQSMYQLPQPPPQLSKFQPKSLYLGRLYYPSSVLETMMIKRLSPYTQMTIKCISSTTRGSNLNVWTCYWQHFKKRNCQEWILSSNDGLCGYRILHNVVTSPSKFNNSLYNNSSLVVGAELWLAMGSLNPGCSTGLRYCTHSANTGRPLTLTFTWSPLFGHISSSYSAKTSTNSTFTTQYDFNLYSTESNLSFGCEFWRNDNTKDQEPRHYEEPPHTNVYSSITNLSHDEKMDQEMLTLNDISTETNITVQEPILKNPTTHQEKYLKDLTKTFQTSLQQIDKERSIIEDFENKFNNKDFSSVWKFSTSLMDKNLKILWEGKFKGFLLSAGTELLFKRTDDKRIQPIINPSTQFGLKIQYSS